MVAGPDAPHDVGFRGRAFVIGQDAGEVHLGHRAVGQRRVGCAVQAELHVVARQVALRAAGLEEVAAAPYGEEARRAEELRVAAAARGAHEALRALLLVVLPHHVRDLVDGLFPGDALPFVGAALADALHGVLDAVGVVQRLDAGETLRAGCALVHGVVRVAFELDDLAVAHVRDHAAVVEAGAADGPDLLRFARLGRHGGFDLHEVRPYRAAHRGGGSSESAELHEAAPADVCSSQNVPSLLVRVQC